MYPISKGIQKSSKRKQCLYEKKNPKNTTREKEYKTLFETFKRNSKMYCNPCSQSVISRFC